MRAPQRPSAPTAPRRPDRLEATTVGRTARSGKPYLSGEMAGLDPRGRCRCRASVGCGMVSAPGTGRAWDRGRGGAEGEVGPGSIAVALLSPCRVFACGSGSLIQTAPPGGGLVRGLRQVVTLALTGAESY